MASGLLFVLDDIASLLDDIALLTKVAARKTAGVLGDDLAVNAEQVVGVRAARELPVVFAVFKGSMINKLILVPLALLLSALAPWLVLALLMLGGLYLSYEGAEKLVHRRRPGPHRDTSASAATGGDAAAPDERATAPGHELAAGDGPADLARIEAVERAKIKGAIRTDFILSAEIVVITLGTVADAAFGTQVVVVSLIAVLMTVGVYGLVAAIVRLDDVGLFLQQRRGEDVVTRSLRRLGAGMVGLAPGLMRWLSLIGMIAMFLVGGGILAHGIPGLEAGLHHLLAPLHDLALIGGPLLMLLPLLFHALLGILAGLLLLRGAAFARRWLSADA